LSFGRFLLNKASGIAFDGYAPINRSWWGFEGFPGTARTQCIGIEAISFGTLEAGISVIQMVFYCLSRTCLTNVDNPRFGLFLSPNDLNWWTRRRESAWSVGESVETSVQEANVNGREERETGEVWGRNLNERWVVQRKDLGLSTIESLWSG
jgi:hypothetical protein